MPLWIVILIAGATGCGFLFLKAREMEKAAPYKKLKRDNLTVAKAAKRVAARPSSVAVPVPDFNIEPVNISGDTASRVATEIEEIQKAKEVQ